MINFAEISMLFIFKKKRHIAFMCRLSKIKSNNQKNLSFIIVYISDFKCDDKKQIFHKNKFAKRLSLNQN